MGHQAAHGVSQATSGVITSQNAEFHIFDASAAGAEKRLSPAAWSGGQYPRFICGSWQGESKTGNNGLLNFAAGRYQSECVYGLRMG